MKLKKSLKGTQDIKYTKEVRDTKAIIERGRKEQMARLAAGVRGVDPTLNPNLEATPLKGTFNGPCNVTACQAPGAKVFMPLENSYYCRRCAHKMNDYDVIQYGNGNQDFLRFPRGVVEDSADRTR